MTAYYNEHDPYAAAWLRNLIDAGHIAPGVVDTRSILDVTPADLAGFTQCHFFAGIGGWSAALRLAGWDDTSEVWSGSCPCQPFSVAGAGLGHADERHLWPAWFHLISQCAPPVVFGEQVEAAIRHGWLDLVQTDMEGIGYAFGASGLPAACVGAPHIRQRLWFVGSLADADGHGTQRTGREESGVESGRTTSSMAQSDTAERRAGLAGRHERNGAAAGREQGDGEHGECCPARELAHDERVGRVRRADAGRSAGESATERREGMPNAERGGATRQLADSDGRDTCAEWQQSGLLAQGDRAVGMGDAAGQSSERDAGAVPCTQGRIDGAGQSVNGSLSVGSEHAGEGMGSFWSDAEWIACRDGKARPVEPGTFPLGHGLPARVGRLRGYGNAIVPQCAQAFIEAYMSCRS